MDHSVSQDTHSKGSLSYSLCFFSTPNHVQGIWEEGWRKAMW